jgi:hypothetical protein
LKRLSDRFDEECVALVCDGDDPELKDNHQSSVPRRLAGRSFRRSSLDFSRINLRNASLAEPDMLGRA